MTAQGADRLPSRLRASLFKRSNLKLTIFRVRPLRSSFASPCCVEDNTMTSTQKLVILTSFLCDEIPSESSADGRCARRIARKVGEILAKLPPSSVAIYSRTMANVRSEYHRDKEIERRLHVETTLASILPGSTIKHSLGVSLEDGLGGGVAAMRSKKARHARHAAFKAFVDANCVKQIPGCHPFFRSLFGALWLQSIDPGKGGAGSRRVEWEVDVAVFTEAGGGESWAREAVEALKGVRPRAEFGFAAFGRIIDVSSLHRSSECLSASKRHRTATHSGLLTLTRHIRVPARISRTSTGCSADLQRMSRRGKKYLKFRPTARPYEPVHRVIPLATLAETRTSTLRPRRRQLPPLCLLGSRSLRQICLPRPRSWLLRLSPPRTSQLRSPQSLPRRKCRFSRLTPTRSRPHRPERWLIPRSASSPSRRT